ncbi:NTP transferase domain-containing protein [Marine Group I thaumarchaeote]|uniref:Bifunctional IPC transferase and DIPP synthase n=1 Tax=Marine Group I thaumarchaeote TaxID=2511932 RepID=A0A7K4NIV0_9ARCH|nr:NTP transferase domain-containing protein [Marine Group I thaumarchaeote]NWK14208.1 NTP transferase domain-containing protein [Marine Group I thaumarchaeote]
MKALIIAAGKGTRLRPIGDTKPLVTLLGLGLIERVILTAKKSGIKEFCIVTGYNGEKIREQLSDGKKYGVKIQYVQNDSWTRGNAISILKARDHFKESFVLLMADHNYDHRILNELSKIKIGKDECILCVDRNPGDHLNIDDATKVRTVDHRIDLIGKDLSDYNCIDTGIFICNPVIFDVLEQSISEGDEGLSGGIKILAQRHKMRYMPLGDNFWIDVDDKTDRRNAEMLICNKLKKDTDGPVSRILNRPISLRISKLLLKTGITPNQISVLSTVIGLVGASFFFSGEYFYLILGGILIHIHSIVDGCDGEVARLKLRQTKYGGWLDAVLDRYVDAAIIFGLAYGYWNMTGDMTIWIIGFSALIGTFLNSYTSDKYDSIFKNGDMAKKSKFRMGRDVRLLLIVIGALTNQIPIMLIILAVITNFEAIRRLITFRSKLGEDMQTMNTEFVN